MFIRLINVYYKFCAQPFYKALHVDCFTDHENLSTQFVLLNITKHVLKWLYFRDQLM